jgi:P-loop containing dynein motor region
VHPIGFTYATLFPGILVVQGSSIYEYVFEVKEGVWRSWMDVATPAAVPDSAAAFHDITVQTMDTVRYSWLLNLFITHGKHVLLTGEQKAAAGHAYHMRPTNWAVPMRTVAHDPHEAPVLK